MVDASRIEAKAQRRGQYLSAAARLFAERGYAGVSIDELSSEVGLSGPAVYRHFANKEQILSELLIDVSHRLLQGYQQIVELDVGPLATLDLLICFHINFAVTERHLISVHDRELANLPPKVNRQVRRLQRQYVDGWVRIAADLEPSSPNAELEVRMHAVFGILNSTVHNRRSEKEADVRGILRKIALLGLGYRVSP